MPKILELRVEPDGHVWARLEFLHGEDSVMLWTESEKNAVLAAERERCMQAILDIGYKDDRDHEAD